MVTDRHGAMARPVVFQYNPDSVTRRLQPRAGASGGAETRSADAHRIWGAPQETITMTVELDAADGLGAGDPLAASLGVQPQLSALELLLYPSSAQVIANTALLLAGTIEILPPESPLTVLVWGPGRAVPVAVESLAITEQAFGPALEPSRASVELSLRVLTYSDLAATDPGYALFLVQQVVKETTAMLGTPAAAASATGGLGA